MLTNFTRRSTNILLFMMLVYTINPISIARATSLHVQHLAGSDPQVIAASVFDESRPLNSIVPIVATSVPTQLRNHPVAPKTLNGPGNDLTDASIVQTNLLSKSLSNTMSAPVTSFDGLGTNGYYPPDSNGDVGYNPATGKKYYMQAVNTSFQIWDVTNPAAVTSLYGPAAGNTIFSGMGGICETNNNGDPIVLFDHLASRWMYSQFALNFPNNFHQCIAVSTSADPTGTWYRYDFLYSDSKMNDYPKFGVWPDGYYMSVNQFDGSTDAWRGAGAVAFNRTAMLSGLPATMIKFDIGAVYLGYGLMLPSDLDGPAPSAGTPNYFMEWDDSAWQGDPTDTLRVWNFHVDWATPANSTFGVNASFDPNMMVATANLDSNMCNGARDCIPQPGTAQKLDAIASGQLMYRLQYRNFGSYQTLVGNQTVDATGGDKAGVYWFELRNSGPGWGMNQQGVYAPDADNRWIGSAAMDRFGNIALGYSVSSASTYPSVRYTGRLVSDPLGTLPQGEVSLVAGSGSQTGGNRWGDYSMLTVDPTDDCTFWYTQEYYNSNSSSNWKTRIGSFQFPLCIQTISGNADVGGATLSYVDGASKTVIADGNGDYTITVPNGWSGTVTPYLAGYAFTPFVRTYSNLQSNQTSQDYTAQACVGGAFQGHARSDFNDDNQSDLAVFRPSNGTWYVKNQFNVAYGISGDMPVPSDYDGDGGTDLAVFRPSNGTWYVKNQFSLLYGTSGDIPVPGDYNCDGLADLAVFRPSNGTWYIRNQGSVQYGTSGDIPVPGDYNGDDITDVAVFRPSNGTWYIRNQGSIQFGTSGDIPVPGDYNGDGITDVAVFRPSNGIGIWYVKNQFNVAYGTSGDIPLRGDYNGDGSVDIAVFRPSNGTWYVKNQFNVTYGTNGDIPLSK